MMLRTFISTYMDENKKSRYIRIMGVNLLKETSTMRKSRIELAPLNLWFRSKPSLCFRTIVDYILEKNGSSSEIIIFNSNVGETYLLMFYVREIIQNLRLNNCLFVFNSYAKMILFKKYYPDLKATYISIPPLFNDYVKANEYSYKSRRVILPFSTKYFQKVEKSIRKQGMHYYGLLKRHINLSHKPDISIINKNVNINSNIEKYFKFLGRNYIILCPESNSCMPLNYKFWVDIAGKFINMGLEIYCNSGNIKFLGNGMHNFLLSMCELQALAVNSKAIVGIRSGIFETLVPYGSEFHAIYTSFPRRGHYKYMYSRDVIKGFSLKKLDINLGKKFFEYDYNDFTNTSELIDKIVDNMQ